MQSGSSCSRLHLVLTTAIVLIAFSTPSMIAAMDCDRSAELDGAHVFSIQNSPNCSHNFFESVPAASVQLETDIGFVSGSVTESEDGIPANTHAPVVSGQNLIDDLIATGPAAPSVTVTFHYFISVDAAVTSSDFVSDARLNSRVEASSGDVNDGGLVMNNNGTSGPLCQSLGDMSSFCSSSTATSVVQSMVPQSLTFSVAPNIPFSVLFELIGIQASYDQGAGSARTSGKIAMANDAFGQGPAFVAPPGYSIDSASSGIVNGVFRPAVPVMSWPGLLLLEASVLAIAGRELRRSGHSS
jgi:hypothetical protein